MKKGKLTLLCIDDDLTTLAMLKARLEKVDGHKVITANDGESGIKLAEKYKPDAILIDWEMPKMTGIETVRMLRGNRKTTWIPRFMLTGRLKMHHVERAAKAGIEGYFTKPVNLSLISRRLNSLATA